MSFVAVCALKRAKMSTHFSANQYEQAFAAQRLQNWEIPKRFKERPSTLDGFTQPISNDRGHILPGIARSSNSPWGEFVGTWDMQKPPLRTKTMKTNATSTNVQKDTELPARTPSPKQDVVPDKAGTPTPQQEAIRTPSPQEGAVPERVSSRPPSQNHQCKKSPSPVVAKSPGPPAACPVKSPGPPAASPVKSPGPPAASPAKSPAQEVSSLKKEVFSDPA